MKFSKETGDNDPVRVGGPSNPLLTDGGLSTVISKPNGASGDFLSSSLGRWQNRGSNPDRSLIMAFKTIGTMSEQWVCPVLFLFLQPYSVFGLVTTAWLCMPRSSFNLNVYCRLEAIFYWLFLKMISPLSIILSNIVPALGSSWQWMNFSWKLRCV